MKIEDLLDMDAQTAIEWLIENQYEYAIVPREPTKAMRRAYHAASEEWEIGGTKGSPDYQWDEMIGSSRKQLTKQRSTGALFYCHIP